MSNHVVDITNMILDIFRHLFRHLLTILPALAICLPALADPLIDSRYVSEIKRDANGHIMRRADVLAAFKRIHPCPSTGKTIGACGGWQINHVIPLACFGRDEVSNLSWQPTVIKTCWQDYCQDRFERKIYAIGKGSPSCTNEIVIINDKVQ